MTLECLFDISSSSPVAGDLYTRLDFPDPPADRPYLFINMAATVDGKIVVGEAEGTAKGVGGATDQRLFRRLQLLADAYLIGGTTLRASNVLYPPERPRYVVSRGGDLPLRNRFFTDAPGRGWALLPEDAEPVALARLRESIPVLAIGREDVDLVAAMRILRQDHGIRYLLCEGGGALNDAMVRAGLADELFLTIAPKLKGGAHLPTLMSGQGFPPDTSQPLQLRSLYRDEDELYLRYRIAQLAPVA